MDATGKKHHPSNVPTARSGGHDRGRRQDRGQRQAPVRVARRGRSVLMAAMVTIVVIAATLAAWGAFEDGIRSWFDRICCGQLIAFPAPTARLAAVEPASNPTCDDARRLVLLQPRNDAYAFLDTWPEARRDRLDRWLELGIRFEGPWRSDELSTAITILDGFAHLYGDERFVAIVHEAVRTRSDGWRNYLTIRRTCGATLPGAAWNPRRGRIELNDLLFDPDSREALYSWEVLMARDGGEPDAQDYLNIVIAHELGHVLLDGLRQESGEEMTLLEDLYVRHVPDVLYPHEGAGSNENLATEMGAWALGYPRPYPILSFRREVLSHTTAGDAWSDRVITTTSGRIRSR